MFTLMFKAACTDKQWSFPLRIYVVKVNQFTWNFEFVYIYWRHLYWETSYFVQCGSWVNTCSKLTMKTAARSKEAVVVFIVDCEHVYWFGRICKAEDYSTSKIVTVKLHCSKLAIRISERCQWYRYMDLLLALNKLLYTPNLCYVLVYFCSAIFVEMDWFPHQTYMLIVNRNSKKRCEI